MPLLPLLTLFAACAAPSQDPIPASFDRSSRVQAEVPPPTPISPLPSGRQLAWHELESYAFVHFNMNTFTDEEWGHGTESPNTFAPTELDCHQWARVVKEAGMKAIILTAKHHDGFCLWPSDVTEHDVASSAWRDGKGDVLAELAEACRAEGLKLGLYLSPWDRAEPSYGDSEAYNQHFAAQLTEILTRYGPVFEVWFDGACGEGPNGKRQVYDWDLFERTVHEHQPDAVIFHGGRPDLRWIGNERGIAGETNWNPYRSAEYFVGTSERPAELNVGHEDGDAWIPGEADVSIRPGWYYHASQDDQVKSLEHLEEIWLGSVGRGTNLLLNLPVDRRGLVHENDAERLGELAQLVRSTFGRDLAGGAAALASNVRGGDPAYAASMVLGDEPGRFWSTDDGTATGWVELRLPQETSFDRVQVMEAIALGQRVQAFRVEAWLDGTWREIGRGTTVGRQRILPVPPTRTDRVRVVFERAKGPLCIRRIGLYAAPVAVTAEATARDFVESTTVTLVPSLPGAEVRYSLDGTEVTAASALYEGPLTIEASCTLRARGFAGGVAGLKEARLELVSWAGEALLEARAEVDGATPGLSAAVFEGGWQTLDQMPGREPSLVTGVTGLDVSITPVQDHVAVAFEGWLRVPAAGVWTLHLTSDDGSRLYLGSAEGQVGDDPRQVARVRRLAIDNDGLHGAVTASRALGLEVGLHELRVEWFNATGGRELRLEWEGPGVPRQPVPASALLRVD